MSNELLILQNVSVSFNNKKTFILKDINFSVDKGEIISIIGLNGSGKTTLLKCIAGIQKITEGKIIRNYKNLYYVPQKINLDSTFPITIKEFINIYNSKINDEEIKKYLKKFNMENFLERNISSLSGGELQKILIISGLISKPDLLLLDEPTASVDSISEKIFYDITSEVKKIFPDISIILVSHNINLVYKNSDKVICLHEDNFCCHGTPGDLKNNKKIAEIFGEYNVLYEHNPHKKH